MSILKNSYLHFLILFLFSKFEASLEDELASLQSCLDGFEVHRDKIIRTEDSIDMGAKFLGEIDVDSRIGCQKWCCESKHCDVFVFEEKKPGSCYLFHCGPPGDFKCKFTNHSNYSSAVLTNYDLQKAAALEEESHRNQQEHELQSLRRLDSPGREYNSYFGDTVSTTSTSTPEPFRHRTTTSTSTTSAPIKGPTCNRNQFECRSNEDCIAIYNVCDGIPQCPDGSDEAAELRCPPERTTLAPAPKPPFESAVALLPELIQLRYQQMIEQQQQQQQQQHGQVIRKFEN
ncbi:hypothetical protein QAD02_009232 [Eretmocerus hayati]|uniref:Uncharacterized protein n=1 Tax=Eretmocerus hayati TaxID=131215 RepID=A0ACC2N8M9_9HYME|nr:hypothetical protein QAD02_009232 [Eretmocerus hayati]